LLAAISEATPRIAPYPFTTLTPQLGVVRLADYRSMVVADIPGIIEGAHEGKGLGLRFLRHIERTRVLAYLIPVDSEDPGAEYRRLRTEVSEYSAVLATKPHILIHSKTDLLGPEGTQPDFDAPDALATFGISSVAHQGLKPMLESLWACSRTAMVEEQRTDDRPADDPGALPGRLPGRRPGEDRG
jgi:GTP-binding protein